MGALESLVEQIAELQNVVIDMTNMLKELRLQQDNEEVWGLKDIEEFTGFKYKNVKELTNNVGFPKFYIGKTECYLKSEVIKYLKNIGNQTNELNFKGKQSTLYRVK